MKLVLNIFFLMAVLCANPVFAQKDHERDRVEKLRSEFISKRLELSASESEKFWPVYNEYNDKLKAIKRNLRQSYKSKGDGMSEAQAEELFQLEHQSRQAETDVHKQYSERIKVIIGVKKVILLRRAEEEFKKEMIRSIQEKNE